MSACAAVSGTAATTLSRRTVLQLQRATAVQGASGTLHGVLSEYMFFKISDISQLLLWPGNFK